MICPVCGGCGARLSNVATMCPKCNGHGWLN